MSHLLTDPTTVLVLSTDGTLADTVRFAVLEGDVTEVLGVPSVEAAARELESRDDVGCVVVGGELTDASLVEACRSLSSNDELLPIVAYVTDGSERLASEAVRAGAAEYFPRSVEDEVLRTSVEEAILTYRTRREATEESDMFRTFLERIGIPMYVKDHQARHLRLSNVPGGLKPESARGKTDVELYEERSDEARETYEDDLNVIRNEEEVYERVERFDDLTEEYWSRTTKIPWYDDDGTVKGLVGVSLNVTDYVKAQQRLEEHRERIDQFASYVSHDLQTPLQIASGSIELARETDDEGALDRASDALNRIDEMIDDLGSIAKDDVAGGSSIDVESDDLSNGFERTPFSEVVADVWNVVRTDAATLELLVPDDARINAPETTVRPVFENLFKNAITHVGDDVTVRVGLLNDGFYVEDDGPGIPEEKRDKVLQEGYTTAAEGSGTGLSIVSETVGQHDWDLTIFDVSDAGVSDEHTESEARESHRSPGARFEFRNCLLVRHPPEGHEIGEEIPLDGATRTDVGPTQVSGEAAYDELADRWTVRGGGTNVWRQENNFFFVHTTVEGPVRIQGRIESLENLSEYSKAAFMVRGSADGDAAYGSIGMTPRHGTEILWRESPGTDGVSQHLEEETATFPWYRVDRVGETVTTSLSADGENWYVADQRDVELDDSVEVGLLVCSFVPQRLCEAEIRDVTVRRIEDD